MFAHRTADNRGQIEFLDSEFRDAGQGPYYGGAEDWAKGDKEGASTTFVRTVEPRLWYTFDKKSLDTEDDVVGIPSFDVNPGVDLEKVRPCTYELVPVEIKYTGEGHPAYALESECLEKARKIRYQKILDGQDA